MSVFYFSSHIPRKFLVITSHSGPNLNHQPTSFLPKLPVLGVAGCGGRTDWQHSWIASPFFLDGKQSGKDLRLVAVSCWLQETITCPFDLGKRKIIDSKVTTGRGYLSAQEGSSLLQQHLSTCPNVKANQGTCISNVHMLQSSFLLTVVKCSQVGRDGFTSCCKCAIKKKFCIKWNKNDNMYIYIYKYNMYIGISLRS